MNNGNGNQQRAQQSQELIPVETSQHALALVPSTIDGAFQLARWLANASLLSPALRGKESDIFTIIMAGLELGLPPMAALRGLYVVNGKPALEAKTKAAICLQRGAALYITRVEYTPKATTWETMRRGQTEPVRMRYTREEAEAAGLTRKDGPWQNYPQRMISHRALGWLCDDVYPDIVLGVATAEDFEPEEMTFKPIGGGIELASPPQPKPAPMGPPPGVPMTAKPANDPQPKSEPAPQPDVAAKTVPTKQLTEDEVVDLIESISRCGTIKSLRELAAQRIAGVPDGAIRDRLAAAYEQQRQDIIEAERAAADGGGK